MVGSTDGRYVYIRADGTYGKYVMVNIESGNIVGSSSLAAADEAADYLYGNLLFNESDSQHNDFSPTIFKADSGSFPAFSSWAILHKPITSYSVPLQPAMADGNFYIRGSGGIHSYQMLKTPSNLKINFAGIGAKNIFKNPGDSLRINVACSGDPDEIHLFLNGAEVASVQASALLSYLIPSIPPGTHQVEAKVMKNNGAESFSSFLYINARNIGKVVALPDSEKLLVSQKYLFSKLLFFDNGTQWYRQYVDLGFPIPQPAIEWSVSDSGGTIDANGYFTALKPGTFWVRVRASRNGLSVWDSVQVFITKSPQTLTWLPIPDFFVNQPGVRLSGVLSSGLPIQYEVLSGLCHLIMIR
jgi:hypothetical protein